MTSFWRRFPACTGGTFLFGFYFQFLVCVLLGSLTVTDRAGRGHSWLTYFPHGQLPFQTESFSWPPFSCGSISRLSLPGTGSENPKRILRDHKACVGWGVQLGLLFPVDWIIIAFDRKHLTAFLALVPEGQWAHLQPELWVAPLWGALIHLHHLLIIILWIMHPWRLQMLCVRCTGFLYWVFCNRIANDRVITLHFIIGLISWYFFSRHLKAILNSGIRRLMWKGGPCLVLFQNC